MSTRKIMLFKGWARLSTVLLFLSGERNATG